MILFNPIIKSALVFFQMYTLFVLCWYMPFAFDFFDSDISISIDAILVYVLFQSFSINRNRLIFIGFVLGIMMDLDLEGSSLGLNCFLMPIICYLFGFVKLNSNNWEFRFKLVYIFTIIFSFSILKSFFYQWDLIHNLLPMAINTFVIMSVFLSMNYFLYKKILK